MKAMLWGTAIGAALGFAVGALVIVELFDDLGGFSWSEDWFWLFVVGAFFGLFGCAGGLLIGAIVGAVARRSERRRSGGL